MKKTVIQCVTALLCVIAVAVTSVISVGKISTAKVDAAKAAASNPSASGEPSADPSADPSVDPAAPTDPSADPSATDPSLLRQLRRQQSPANPEQLPRFLQLQPISQHITMPPLTRQLTPRPASQRRDQLRSATSTAAHSLRLSSLLIRSTISSE